VVAANGTRVRTSDDLSYVFEDAGVGAEVTLELIRDRRRREVTLELVPIE
jgi:S1-C subfamily serine protease